MKDIEVFIVAEARDFLDKRRLAELMQEPEILHEYGIREGNLYLGGFDEAENLFVLVRQDYVAEGFEKRLVQSARIFGCNNDEEIARFLEKAKNPVKDENHTTLEQDSYLSLSKQFYSVSYWLEQMGVKVKAKPETISSKLIASIKILQLSAEELEQLIALEVGGTPAFEMEEIESEE